MSNNKSECDCQKCSTAALLEKIFFYEWENLTPGLKQTLNRLLLIYVQSESIENNTRQDREELAFHLHVIGTLLDTLYQHKTNNPNTKAA